MPRCVFVEPACANNYTLVDTPFLNHANEYFFHLQFRQFVVAILTHPFNDPSYPWKRMVGVPMEIFVTWNNDRFIMDHRPWGRDADTMARCPNRQGFHMGGHYTHFWDLNNVGRTATIISSTVEGADVPSHCFGEDIPGVPTSDVYTLYAGVISNIDLTFHDYVVILCPIPRIVQIFVNHHDLLTLLYDTGFSVDVFWLAFDRSCEVE